MQAVYDDCLRQKYTDLKIVCRGNGCVFHVHRLVVCTQSKYLRDAVEALAPRVRFPVSESATGVSLQLILQEHWLTITL